MELLPHIADKRLRELYFYWNRLRGEGYAPARAALDPAAIPRLLPHLLLVDIIEDGRRLRYRLVGTEVERNFGRHMTGRHVDEIMRGRYLDFINGLYRRLLEQRVPNYSENSFRDLDGGRLTSRLPLRTARLIMPLSSDGEHTDMALAGQVFFWEGARANPLDAVQDYFSISESEAKIVTHAAGAAALR
ncbi:MAG: PAS domain-containing protein [Stellaceae bacterium]